MSTVTRLFLPTNTAKRYARQGNDSEKTATKQKKPVII